MAASFVSASSQHLDQVSVPITAVPFTVGLWVRPTTTGTLRHFWSLGDSASNLFPAAFSIGQSAANAWIVQADVNTSATETTSAGAVTANQWAFVFARFITATNRRISVLQSDGSTAHAQGTTSETPTSIDIMSLGCYNGNSSGGGAFANFFDGQVGEFWYTNTDIQADAAQTQESLLRQLAYGGPFSVPHIAKDIVEYRSLRKATTSDRDNETEVYFRGPFSKRIWADVASVTVSHHPPLPYWYVKPEQNERVLTI